MVSGIYLPFSAFAGGVLASQIVHGIAGVLLIAVILAHIYIGTLGMEGAAEVLTTGEVDHNWAKASFALGRSGRGESQGPPTRRATG